MESSEIRTPVWCQKKVGVGSRNTARPLSLGRSHRAPPAPDEGQSHGVPPAPLKATCAAIRPRHPPTFDQKFCPLPAELSGRRTSPPRGTPPCPPDMTASSFPSWDLLLCPPCPPHRWVLSFNFQTLGCGGSSFGAELLSYRRENRKEMHISKYYASSFLCKVLGK